MCYAGANGNRIVHRVVRSLLTDTVQLGAQTMSKELANNRHVVSVECIICQKPAGCGGGSGEEDVEASVLESSPNDPNLMSLLVTNFVFGMSS